MDVPAHRSAILEGIERVIDPAFRDSLAGMENPYGDGTAGKKIAKILSNVDLGPRLLEKRAIPATAIPQPPVWPESEQDLDALELT